MNSLSRQISQSMRLCTLGCLVTLYFLVPSGAGMSEGIWRVPAYTAGCMINGWGAIQLLIRTRENPLSFTLCRIAVALVLLQIYFSPFYYWWVRLPAENFFTLNAVLLLLALLAFPLILLLIHNTLSAGAQAHDNLRWAQLQTTLALLPLMGILCVTAIHAHRYDTAWSAELSEFFRGTWTRLFPAWVFTSYLINLYRIWQPLPQTGEEACPLPG